MANIRVADDIYRRLKDDASRNFRTIGGQIDYLISLADEEHERRYLENANNPAEPLDKEQYAKDQGETWEQSMERLESEVKKSEATPQPVTDDLFVKALPSLENGCCMNEVKPCSHWKWDSETGEGYVNVLSGRKMEIE